MVFQNPLFRSLATSVGEEEEEEGEKEAVGAFLRDSQQ